MGGQRIYYLDWLRTIMVIIVVFAHTAMMGIDGGLEADIIVDDRTYTNNTGHPSDYGPRWMSVGRPWCLPLLFWVSGAAMAFGFKGSPKGIVNVLKFTVAGMGGNAILWFAGPQDPDCAPMPLPAKCVGKGTLFDFTPVPFSGTWFPIVYQMWYTMALMTFMLLNTPLFRVLVLGKEEKWSMTKRLPLLTVQWVCTCSFYLAFELFFIGEKYWRPPLEWLCGLEALFLLVAAKIVDVDNAARRVPACKQASDLVKHKLTSNDIDSMWQPTPAPKPEDKPETLRKLHYILGVITVLQFGGAPIADQITGIEPRFLLYIFIGFNKFFNLGFIMMRANVERPGDPNANAIVSKYWPLAIVLMVLFCPSTNWAKQGNLTYPFLPRATDRMVYVAGGVITMFVLDRIGRWAHQSCQPQPDEVTNASLLLYLLHPWFIVLCLQFKMREVYDVWLTSLAIGFALIYLPQTAKRLVSKGKQKAEAVKKDAVEAREVPYEELREPC